MNMSNDFAIIPITDDNDIYLEPGDEIYIPRIENFVYVSGAVKRPGGYEYKKGKPLKYYIEQAGGFDKKADKANITVVTRYSDILQITDGKNIQEGNIIVVPISQQNKVFPVLFSCNTGCCNNNRNVIGNICNSQGINDPFMETTIRISIVKFPFHFQE